MVYKPKTLQKPRFSAISVFDAVLIPTHLRSMELVKSETGFRELENLRNQVWALIKSHKNSGFGATMLAKPGFQFYFTGKPCQNHGGSPKKTKFWCKTLEGPNKTPQKQRFRGLELPNYPMLWNFVFLGDPPWFWPGFASKCSQNTERSQKAQSGHGLWKSANLQFCDSANLRTCESLILGNLYVSRRGTWSFCSLLHWYNKNK